MNISWPNIFSRRAAAEAKDAPSPSQTSLPGDALFHPTLSSSADFDVEAWFATPELRSSSNKNLLEVVVSWEGVILDIRHYDTPRRIAFGTNSHADFQFPIDAQTDDPSQVIYFPLVEPAKNGFLLCFHPEMAGVVEENGERSTLLDLVMEGKAHGFHRNGRCYYPLLPGVKFQLHSNGLDIQIRYVTAPQFSLKWSRHLGTYAPVLSFSILTHLLMAMLAILSAAPPPPPPAQPPAAKVAETKHPRKQGPIKLAPVRLCIKAPTTPDARTTPPPVKRQTKDAHETDELDCP